MNGMSLLGSFSISTDANQAPAEGRMIPFLFLIRIVPIGFLLLVLMMRSPAAAVEESTIHYAYSFKLGTGVYRVGSLDALVVNLPFSYTLVSASESRTGVKLLLPFSFGYYDYKYSIFERSLAERLATVSFVPGLELTVPMSQRWHLKPFGHAGLGKDLAGGDVAWIYAVGIKSLYRFTWHDVQLGIGNELSYYGYNPEDGESGAFSLLSTGLLMEKETGIVLMGRELSGGFFFIYNLYLQELKFRRLGGRSRETDQEFQFALTLAPDRPFRIVLFDLDRLGIGFRFGDNLSAIYLVGSFPF